MNRANVYIPNPERKFSEQALRTFLVGYILWYLQNNRFIISRHVRFNEKIVYKNLYEIKNKTEFEILEENVKTNGNSNEQNDDNVQIQNNETLELTTVEDIETIKLRKSLEAKNNKVQRKRQNTENISESTTRKQPRREDKVNHKVVHIAYKMNPVNDISFALLAQIPELDIDNEHLKEDEIGFMLLANVNNKDPENYKQAIESYDQSLWKKAILEE